MTQEKVLRRLFLKQAVLLGGSALIAPGFISRAQSVEGDPNEEICKKKFALAAEQLLRNKPIGEVVIAMGKSFLGTTYVANVLEVPGPEQLIVDMQGLDCVTFVENALSLSRCVKAGTTTFDDYKKQLQLIRYRNGIIDEYPSRLHYFSDWIHNNEAKKTVRNVTKILGGLPFAKLINYMSTHASQYKQLENDFSLQRIRIQESKISTRKQSFIAKENLDRVQSGIKNGDIIGITTSMRGMDVAHTGLAIWVDGTLRLLHAPLSGARVEMSEKSLVDYLQSHEKQTGIMVARPLEPATVKSNSDD